MPSVPSAFHCEHTQSKSRVLALIHHNGTIPALQAVLTCTDPLLAHRVASALTRALSGQGPAVTKLVDSVANDLPAAPAASFRQATEWIFTGSWPEPSVQTPRWDDIHNTYPDYDSDDDDQMMPDGEDAQTRTPSGAHLADLKGTVVRMTRLLEWHVHDPQRFLQAAQAQGWTPLVEEDERLEDLTEQTLVLDAAMWVADEDPDAQGVDTVTHSSHGEVLALETGDEVADWSPTPITADFGSGWLLGREERAANIDPS